MSDTTKTFVIADPRYMDGDSYEVAERSCLQAAAVAKLLASAISGARLMARNAEMERKIIDGQDPDAVGFDDTPQGRKLAALKKNAEASEHALKVLAKAAGYNPKAVMKG